MHNRLILFRGKRSNNGEWVYGSPIFQDGWVSIRFWNSEEFEYEEYLVMPNTVGQYTELCDKNGKKIFEGDIVKCCDYKGVINYIEGCYCVKEISGVNNPAIDIVFDKYENEIEVIGNIYDNPELLKGGTMK